MYLSVAWAEVTRASEEIAGEARRCMVEGDGGGGDGRESWVWKGGGGLGVKEGGLVEVVGRMGGALHVVQRTYRYRYM